MTAKIKLGPDAVLLLAEYSALGYFETKRLKSENYQFFAYLAATTSADYRCSPKYKSVEHSL